MAVGGGAGEAPGVVRRQAHEDRAHGVVDRRPHRHGGGDRDDGPSAVGSRGEDGEKAAVAAAASGWGRDLGGVSNWAGMPCTLNIWAGMNSASSVNLLK